MRILVLGGTSFVGRAIVEESVAHGDTVTIFNRGETGSDLFPDVERRHGDRSIGEYGSLAEGRWDAMIDVSGYLPRQVRQAAGALTGRVGRYLFISTVSVYDVAQAGRSLDEDSPRVPPDLDTEEQTPATYAPLKVACEDLVQAMTIPTTIVRPGIVAGPHDPTDRFTWWVRRATGGGTTAISGRAEQPIQVVDVHDLAALVRLLVTGEIDGVYNGVGPLDPVDLAGMARACGEAAGTSLTVRADPSAPTPPLVLDDPAWDAVFCASAARARSLGMPATPLRETAAKVLAWDRERGRPPLAAGPPLT